MNPLDFSDYGEAAVRGFRDGVADVRGEERPFEWRPYHTLVLAIAAILAVPALRYHLSQKGS